MSISFSLAPRSRRSTPNAVLLYLMLLGFADTLVAGPSVAELLAVCESGFAQGNIGRNAAACEWYTAPCACKKRSADTGEPRWCVPASGGIDATVRKVLDALRRHPDPAADVDLVVPAILERIYPCGTP